MTHLTKLSRADFKGVFALSDGRRVPDLCTSSAPCPFEARLCMQITPGIPVKIRSESLDSGPIDTRAVRYLVVNSTAEVTLPLGLLTKVEQQAGSLRSWNTVSVTATVMCLSHARIGIKAKSKQICRCQLPRDDTRQK